jgi:NAD(P)H-dependent FMN reductase
MDKPNIAIVIGSTRPGRICKDIAEWVMNIVKENDQLNFSFIDLLEINLPFLDEPIMAALNQYKNDHTKQWSKLISSYDGFVFVAPQYNWGYPAPLKNSMDYLYAEWANKPASIITYGTRGGVRASIQLQEVLEGLHMRNTATNPQLSFSKEMLDENFQLKDINTDFLIYKKTIGQVAKELTDMI